MESGLKDLEIKESLISGKGVFATKDILSGERICYLNGELCSLDEILSRVSKHKEEPSDPLQVDIDEYLDLEEASRMFNHSCSPNSFVRGRNELVSMQDIKNGDEVVFDYSTTMNDDEERIKSAGREVWIGKCNCGNKNCRGKIDQFKTLTKDIQEYYITNKYMPDFMLKAFQEIILR